MQDKSLFLLLMVGSASITLLTLLTLSTVTESTIPPTDAFSKIYINGQLIEADQYNDELYIITPGSITTTINGDTVTIKLKSITCTVLQGITGVDTDGNFVCNVI